MTDEQSWPRRVAVLGVGLLGGSVALSIRRSRPRTSFVGWVRHEVRAEQLRELGIVDVATTSLQEACEGSDVVVVAVPVDQISALVAQSARLTPAGCLITDVGSTKRGIVEALAGDGVSAAKFVPAHPIAGSEKSGPQHATGTLFDGKLIVLTPGEETPEGLRQKADHFWRLTGGTTREMGPDEHDTHLAAISHVPHLVSALVANMTYPQARSLVGSGWADMTRIAAGDPVMWTAICRENRMAIRQELQRFSDELQRLRSLLDQEDDAALQAWLAQAQRVKQQTP